MSRSTKTGRAMRSNFGRARLSICGRARLLPSLALIAILGSANLGQATETGPQLQCSEPRSCCLCPDDYCPKLQPCVPCAPLGCCNDYCPKLMPCTAPLIYCGPNDYCPKPCCFYLPPCWPAWYSCGTAQYAAAASR
jgi:hypothetical protein